MPDQCLRYVCFSSWHTQKLAMTLFKGSIAYYHPVWLWIDIRSTSVHVCDVEHPLAKTSLLLFLYYMTAHKQFIIRCLCLESGPLSGEQAGMWRKGPVEVFYCTSVGELLINYLSIPPLKNMNLRSTHQPTREKTFELIKTPPHLLQRYMNVYKSCCVFWMVSCYIIQMCVLCCVE